MDPNQLEGELPYPDHDKGPGILQVLWILGAISIIVVALRIYTKITKTRRLYWDDTLMVLALVWKKSKSHRGDVAVLNLDYRCSE